LIRCHTVITNNEDAEGDIKRLSDNKEADSTEEDGNDGDSAGDVDINDDEDVDCFREDDDPDCSKNHG